MGKKFLTTVLIICLLVMLVGCNSKDEGTQKQGNTTTNENVAPKDTADSFATSTPEPTATSAPASPEETGTAEDGQATPIPATPELVATEAPEPVATGTPEPTATSTPEPTATPAVTEETKLSLGKVVDQCYYNEDLKVKCELGNVWYFLDEDEINQMNSAVYDALDISEGLQEQAEKSTVYLMYALSILNTKDTMMISYQDLGVSGWFTDEKAYLKNIMPYSLAALEQAGISDTSYTEGTVTVCGEELNSAKITGTADGEALYELIAVKKFGNNMVMFVSTTYGNDTSANNFTKFQSFEGEIPEPIEVMARPYSVGDIVGNTYENAFLNIRFDAGDTSTITDRAAIMQALGLSADATLEDFALVAKDSYGCVLFKADDAATGCSIIIGTEKLGDLASVVDEELYLSIVTEGLEETYTSIGVTDMEFEIGDIVFVGENHKALACWYELMGVEGFQAYVAIKVGEHIGYVVITGAGATEVSSVISRFMPY